LIFFYLEDEQWEDFLETIVENLKKEEKSELESNDTKKRTPVSDEVFEQRVKEIAELLSEFGFEKEKVDNFVEAAKKQIQASQKEGTN
jgi:translation initiation factor 2 alpha subunit (eIF-2alpha)